MTSNSVATLSELTLKGQALTPRWGLSAAHIQGRVYIFGGYLWFHGVEGFFNDLYELDLSTSTLRRLPSEGPQPCLRFGHTLLADPARNQLVLFGGRNSTESLNDVWIYNINRNQWALVHGSKHEVSTPKSSNLSTSPSITSSPEELQSSRKQEKKTSKRIDRNNSIPRATGEASTSPQERSWHTASFHRNGMYVYGGWDHNNRVFNDLWCFDILRHQWSCINPPDAMAKPPHGRSCHQAAVWCDFLYIYGGLRDGEAAIGDMWRFSFETKSWTPVECSGPRPVGRTSAAGAVVGDSWVLHGGLTDYPRTGAQAISDVLEFHFPSNTWIPRSVVQSDGTSAAARRYGHVAVAQANSTSIILLSGSEKYGSACAVAACRVDLLPTQGQVTELQQDMFATSRVAQVNRERIAELIEAVQTYEVQNRQLKTENVALGERCQALQTQMAALHQQQSALQASFQGVQQALSSVEQFIPMMRSVGAAIANFGGGAGAVPGSSASIARSNALQSTSELR